MKLHKQRFLVYLLLLSRGTSFITGGDLFSSGGPLSENQAMFDVQYYDLNLKINPATQSISGFVDVRITSLSDSLSTIELDLIDHYSVESVTTDHNVLPFQHENHKLIIKLPTSLSKGSLVTYRIAYYGRPPVAKRPPWEGGFNWSTDSTGAPWVGVSCQGEGAKIWWPCKDHPSDEPDSVAINITIPDTLVCASNGVLEGITDHEDGWHTYYWKTRYPINNYSVTVNIADYEIRKRIYHGEKDMELVFYVLKEDTAGADSLLMQAEEMLSFYAKSFGEYPFIDEKFGLAQTDYYGMEHQTINSYGNKYRNTELGYDFLMLHEMGHEWWGNYLTADDWADFWLHEGIDIYAEAMFIEEKFGTDKYHRFFRETVQPKIQNQRPIIPKRNATTGETYSIDAYYKGAYIIHMLRYFLGKEKVEFILKTFVSQPKLKPHNHVVTRDFVDLVHEYTDQNLDWFFERYLLQADPPILKAKVRKRRSGTTLGIQWLTPNFSMPVEINILRGNQETQERIDVSSGKQIFHYLAGSEIVIDPEGWILYRVPESWLSKNIFKRILDRLTSLGNKSSS